jgi:integrase/recombinase XerD
MALTKPTANVFFDTRTKIIKSSKHPVKLTVYYLGVKRRYKLPHYFTKVEWKKLNSPRLRDATLKDEKIKLDSYTGKRFENALKQIEEPFTFEKFQDVYFNNDKAQLLNKDVFAVFNKVISEREKAGKVGTASIYRSASNSIKKFRSKLNFNQITPEFLRDYEADMRKGGLSATYISINIRNLRAIYNTAIHEGIIKDYKYPFSQSRNDKKYKIKKGSNKKIALTFDELKRLRQYQPESVPQRKAFLFWWFSFYCNGMNVKDICQLQHKHIIGDTIKYIRAKTIETESEIKPIHFKLNDTISLIIDEFGNQDNSPDAFMFAFLQHGDSAQVIRKKVQNLTHVINTHMKKISKVKLEFGKIITTYTARHSYATYLYRSGSSIEEISESLGHASIETTQRYLASFDDEVLQKQSDKLLEI